MPTNKLKDAHCRGVAAGDKPRKLFDGGGLYLYILPAGVKLWRIAYRYGGKQNTLSLGAYPDVSLADARQRLAEAKALLRAGKNPRKAKYVPVDSLSFRAATENYWHGRHDLSAGYVANALRSLELHLNHDLGDKAVGAITRAELLEILRRLDAAGKHVYVRKVRMWAGQVFEWAVENGHAENNPAAPTRPDGSARSNSPVEASSSRRNSTRAMPATPASTSRGSTTRRVSTDFSRASAIQAQASIVIAAAASCARSFGERGWGAFAPGGF